MAYKIPSKIQRHMETKIFIINNVSKIKEKHTKKCTDIFKNGSQKGPYPDRKGKIKLRPTFLG